MPRTPAASPAPCSTPFLAAAWFPPAERGSSYAMAHTRRAGVTSLGGAGVPASLGLRSPASQGEVGSPANDRQHVHGRDSSASGDRPRHQDPTATERWPIPTLRSHTTALRSMLLHRQYVPLSAKRVWSRMNRGRPGIYRVVDTSPTASRLSVTPGFAYCRSAQTRETRPRSPFRKSLGCYSDSRDSIVCSVVD